jgi:hypothetical protein
LNEVSGAYGKHGKPAYISESPYEVGGPFFTPRMQGRMHLRFLR